MTGVTRTPACAAWGFVERCVHCGGICPLPVICSVIRSLIQQIFMQLTFCARKYKQRAKQSMFPARVELTI